MIFQSSVGLRNQGATAFNGIAQGNFYSMALVLADLIFKFSL
jgi:hypothetical protein